jgi:predicted ATPase
MNLKRIRGLIDQEIQFDFPVTALIGVNGGGKTTVLGAAGLAYIEVEPKTFFAKGGSYDPEMKDWKVQHEYLDRPINPHAMTSTASYKSKKWDRKKLDRQVITFGVIRTVPANERKELRKCSSGSFQVAASKIKEIEEEVKLHAGRILGKDLNGFRRMEIDSTGKVKFLAGATENGTSYSEFHFGAGESSVIRIVTQIEASNDHALVLIEEIENGLHPVATQKLVEYLISAAKRKNIQCIFTTHSNHALEILPDKAIWAISGGIIRQGKLDIESLRALTGRIEKDAVIFVEDKFALRFTTAILRQHSRDLLSRTEIHAMQGDSVALRTTREHRSNPAATAPALCLLDGDSSAEHSGVDGVFRLPGYAPEIEVFGKVLESWEEVGGRLTIGLQQRHDQQEEVKQALNRVQNEVGDHHLYFQRAAEVLGFLPTETVEEAFCNLYAQHFAPECSALVGGMLDYLGPTYKPE